MAELRLAPLSPHVEYTIDCAVEGFELDPCSHLVLRLYGDREELDQIVGGPIVQPPGIDDAIPNLPAIIEHHRGRLRERRALCCDLAEVADRILARLPAEEAGGLAYSGLRAIPAHIEETAEFASANAIVDSTVGGNMKAYRDHHRLKDGVPFRRLAARLASPRFIKRYVRHETDLTYLRPWIDRSLARAERAQQCHLRSRFKEAQAALQRQMEAERQAHYRRILHTEIDGPKRKMIRRAAETAVSVVGERAVSDFIHGRDVEIPGDTVTLVIARRGSLAAIGHGSMTVAVKDGQGDLATLCVFFKGTPALDQLTAIALHMQAGLEAEVLKTANVINASERGLTHPLLAEKMKPISEIIDGVPPRPDQIFESSWERDRRLSKMYWAQTGPMWVDRVTIEVLGRRRHQVEAMIAAGRAA